MPFLKLKSESMKKIKVLLPIAFLLVVAASSCKKESSSQNDPFPFHFTATINGSAVKYEANDLNSRYGCGISQPENSYGDTDYDVYEGTVILDEEDVFKNSIAVHILKYFNHDPSHEERHSMIKLGSYSYGVGDVSNLTVNGATIEYTDANGVAWISEIGSQSGSTFEITEIVDNPDGTSGKIFKATFSCKLYDGTGASIQVSNATIRGKLFLP